MNLVIEIPVVIKAEASSTFSRETVERRLEELRHLKHTEEVIAEAQYLLALKNRKGWN